MTEESLTVLTSLREFGQMMVKSYDASKRQDVNDAMTSAGLEPFYPPSLIKMDAKSQAIWIQRVAVLDEVIAKLQVDA